MLVILTPLTKGFLDLFVNPELPLSGMFTPCCSELATENLPRYWDVRLQMPMPLCNVLWIDTKVLNLSRLISYQPMQDAVGSGDLMVEKLGYLVIRSQRED